MQYRGRTIRLFCFVCLLACTAAFASPDLEPSSQQDGRKWRLSTIRLSVSRSLYSTSARIRNFSDISSAIGYAAEAWEAVVPVQFRIGDSHLESVSNSKSSGDGTNLLTVAATPENLALFPEQERSTPAFTRLFFNRSGSIIEADIVLNPYVSFSTDHTPGTYDLQAVVTHELGHVLGLKHSPSMSATMYERMSLIGENSKGGLGARALSLADISSARAIYGASGTFGDCCTTVLGSMSPRARSNAIIWAEESASGRLAAAEPVSGGRFSIGGFDTGRYVIRVQGDRHGPSTELLDGFLDIPMRTKPVELGTSSDLPDVRLIGAGGELGTSPLMLEKGVMKQIFVGGVGLDPANVVLGFSSKSISIVEGSVFPIDYGPDLTALALSISVSPDTLAGDYSLFVETPNGARRYMIGCLSIR